VFAVATSCADTVFTLPSPAIFPLQEWSMLFGGFIETRIVHEFLDHWNEAILDGKWVHIDSTLAYPISLDLPHHYA